MLPTLLYPANLLTVGLARPELALVEAGGKAALAAS